MVCNIKIYFTFCLVSLNINIYNKSINAILISDIISVTKWPMRFESNVMIWFLKTICCGMKCVSQKGTMYPHGCLPTLVDPKYIKIAQLSPNSTSEEISISNTILQRCSGSSTTFAMATMDVALQPTPEENHKEVDTHGKQTRSQGMFQVQKSFCC